MRDRLIELLNVHQDYGTKHTCGEWEEEISSTSNEIIADYLLANGVIVPPCKVGDEIKGDIVREIKYVEFLNTDGKVTRSGTIYPCDKNMLDRVTFVSCPITWEDAEKALKGGVQE